MSRLKQLSFVCLSVLLVLSFFQLAAFPATDEDIEEVEVNQYEGEKLGSIKDFRENSIRGVQEIDLEDYRLTVEGLVEKNKEYKYSELQNKKHIKKVVTLNCVEGWSVKALWEGIPLEVILEEAEVKPEANTVILYAADGYSTSLSLSFVLDNNIMIADKLNGVQLPPRQGFPFQLVAEQKWGYKWIRWIERIELSTDTDYQGFWESRGYSDSGNVDEPMFD